MFEPKEACLTKMSIKVKTNKVEAGANKIIEALQNKGKLSILDMMDLLQVNRQSVYNYLKRIVARGIKLHTEADGHSMLYSLAKGNTSLAKYESMDLNVLRSFTIVRKLQQKAMEPKELIKVLNVTTKAKKEEADGYFDQETDLGRTQFDKLIRSLLEQGILTQVKKRAKLFPSGQGIPVLLNLDQDEMWALCDKLESVAPGNPFYTELQSIYQKLSVLGAEANDMDENIYHIYGKKYSQFNNVRNLLTNIPLQSCVVNIVKYYYKSFNSGKLNSVYMATGIIVYSTDKDRAYILGKQTSASGKIYDGHIVIRLDSVVKVEATNKPNKYWLSKEFYEICETMYSIASDTKQEKIVVEFDNIGNIRSKLENILYQRKQAKLSYVDNKIIYTDVVMGLPDVENYLRQFGKSCRILEPLKLKELMQYSVAKSLNAYEEYEREKHHGSIL